MRQIAPEMFAPVYRDPHAPAHKLPAPHPAPLPTLEAAPVAAAPPPPAVVPSRDKPYGACEPAAPNFVARLSAAVELADRSVEETEHDALAEIGQRPDINPVVAEGAARGLRAAGEAWRMLRDRECADLPLIEAGLSGSIYQRRLVCRIRRDIERVETLRARYAPAG